MKSNNRGDRIVVNSQIHFGKPCIAGTRIPVSNVLDLIREGLSFEEIMRDYYPDLAPEDIRACAQYANESLDNIAQLLANPIQLPDFQPMSRDEAHSRR